MDGEFTHSGENVGKEQQREIMTLRKALGCAMRVYIAVAPDNVTEEYRS